MRSCYPVRVICAETGEPVDAQICDKIIEANFQDFEKHWVPGFRDLPVLGELSTAVPEDEQWDWRGKVKKTQGKLSYRHFVLECDKMTQGFMRLELTHRSRMNNEHLIYIDYVAVAPWNQTSRVKVPRFKTIGTILFTQAVGTSFDEQFAGRLGLHALPGAVTWYRDRLKMRSFGPDKDYHDLEYFEYDEALANQFMDKCSK